jgi:hypothetical protein
MNIFEYIGHKFDILAACVGVLLGLLAISLSFYFHFNQEHVGFAVLLPSLLYLVLRKKLGESKSNILDLKCEHSHELVSFIAFIFLFSLSLLLLRSAVYQRPLTYFITITLIATVIAYQILNVEKRYAWFVLIEILLVSVNIRASVYFLYSDIYGFDISYYVALINEIISIGHIPSDYPGAYDSFFMMPLTVAAVKQIFGLNMKYAYFSIGVIEAVSPIFLFFICKHLFNFKSGLMAALILALSNYYIGLGYWIIAMSLGLSIFSLILLLAILKVSKSEVLSRSLLILFLLIIILTHTIATSVTFVVITSLAIGATVLPLLKARSRTTGSLLKGDNIKATFTIALLFLVSFITYWMNVFPKSGTSFFANIVHSVNCAFTSTELGEATLVTTVTEMPNYIPILLASLGYLILLILATMGILTSLSPVNVTNKKFAVAMSAFILMGVVYIPSAFNFTSILPGRWFPFMCILLSIFAPSGIFALMNLVRSHVSKNMVGLVIISVFVFFMITAPAANPDNGLYANDFRGRIGLYDSEVKAGDFAANKCVTVSKNSVYYIPGLQQSISINLEKPETYYNSTLILREYDLKKGFYESYTRPGFGEYKRAGEDFVEYFRELNIIYNNGMVMGYI